MEEDKAISELKRLLAEKVMQDGNRLPLISLEDLKKIKVGDTIIRALGGVIKMELVVHSIDNGIISTYNEKVTPGKGWMFNAETGLEIDERIGWDGVEMTGSYIVGYEPQRC